MQTGIREEAASPGGGGGTGGGGGRFHRLWEASCPGHLLQVPRASSIGRRQCLAGFGPQHVEGIAEMGEPDTGLEQRGRECPDLGTDIIGSVSVGNFVRVRDVGDDAAHREGVT